MGGTNVNLLLYNYFIEKYENINKDFLKDNIGKIKIESSDFFKKYEKEIYNKKIQNIDISLDSDTFNEICKSFKNKINLLLDKIIYSL